MSLEESIKFVGNRLRRHTSNSQIDSSNHFHQQFISFCGGIQRFLELYAESLVNYTLGTNHEAIEVFQKLYRAVAAQYQIEQIRSAFGEENDVIVKLLYLSHFKTLETNNF